jgi:predicted RNase H-like HicB family nuclease
MMMVGIRWPSVVATVNSNTRPNPAESPSLDILQRNGRRNPQKYLQTGRIKAMREYAVIFEKTSTGWSAYVPDLPGLGVAGPTYEATEQLIREGINFHIEGLRADGDPIPEPTTRVAKMPISA